MLPPLPEIHPTRQQRGRSDCADEVMPPGTSAFPLYASCKHYSGVFTAQVLVSVFMIRMSWTLSILLYKRSWIRRSPFCSVASGGGEPSLNVEPLVPDSLDFGLFTEQPEKMRGYSRTWEGVKALPDRSATPSRSSLWRAVTRPPLLQLRAWQIVNLALQLSQYFGRSGGYRPYLRKRVSRHSCAPISVPFTVDSCTVSQAPVFVARCSQRALWTGASVSVSASASSARCVLRRQTAVWPS